MWIVEAVAEGQLAPVDYAQLSGDRVVPRVVADTCAQLAGRRPVHRSLAELIRQDLLEYPWAETNPGMDLIQRWSRLAVEAFSPVPDGAALDSLPDGPLELQNAERQREAVAWHDNTFVVVPFSPVHEEIDLRYMPDLADQELAAQTETATELRSTAYFDWRLYLADSSVLTGGGSTLILGMHQFDRRPGNRPGRVRVATGNFSGWLVGKILRRSTADVRTFPGDRTVAARVRWYAERYPSAAVACPDLADAPPPSTEQRVMVVVHGTGSCAVPAAEAIRKAGVPGPIYRYEHDTFVSIAANARELATLAQRLQSPALVLACHSRGGLVGRRAAYLLRTEMPGTPVQVLTFGTPHDGTPLANLPPKEIGAVYLLGFTNHGGRPYPDPVTAAFRYLRHARETPAGIAEMRPACGVLELLNQTADPALDSWGGCYDCGSGPTGFGPAMKVAFGREVFSGADNDLVVATASATSRGTAHEILHCSHFDYFDQAGVLSHLKAL
jgi:hypothetical protein